MTRRMHYPSRYSAAAIRRTPAPLLGLLLALPLGLLLPGSADAGRARGGAQPLETVGHQLFASPQSNPIAMSPDGSRVYVAATTSDRVDVINTSNNNVMGRIEVGVEPVALAVRPDGNELWVSNHVSDSVSVIDTDPASATLHQVVETIQSLDGDLVTQFDEPVGIAFASNSKAYVALSSRNQVAIVNATTYEVTGFLDITAQDPRALAVRNGLLYVAAFESGNQSELSACPFTNDPPQCTLDDGDLGINGFAVNPNLPDAVKNIVIDPDVPDRDLFVFDTSTDQLVEAVTGVGTLLYGLVVDSNGKAFVTQTDARNAENGLDGMSLADLDNRIFLNQVAEVSCNAGGCGAPNVIELEPAPPAQPAAGDQLATPYGVQISDDDSTLVATAAASSRIFTLDTATGSVLGRLDVGAIPRGVALRSDPSTGAPATAYVLNTLGNSVTVVDVSDPTNPAAGATIAVGSDPTDDAVRLGRIAFNDANGTTSGTFSCASCHPDGNTDQVLWRIGGGCVFGSCTGEDEPRSTMPVRGLKNTLPLHWDGTLGDPFGGPNGSVGTGGVAPPNCDVANPQTCFRQLVDASLAGVSCDQSDGCASGGELSETERNQMARFLASVSYPPARSRRADDVVTADGNQGFRDFFIDHGGLGSIPGVGLTTCADTTAGCHALPLGTSTNSPIVGAFDAPTMRGMTDRFLQFSLGVSNPEEVLVAAVPALWNPADGLDEFVVFAAAFPEVFTPVYNVPADQIFQMFEEASTGFSGATARQVTLNTHTTNPPELAGTQTLLAALEAADQKLVLNLRGVGLRNGNPIALELRSDGLYHNQGALALTTNDLIAEAQVGTLLLTLTAELRGKVGSLEQLPQPLLASHGNPGTEAGDPPLPVEPANVPITVRVTGIDIFADPKILVNGQPAAGSVACVGGSFSLACTTQVLDVTLDAGIATGLQLLQIQNALGLLSNELPICGGTVNDCQ